MGLLSTNLMIQWFMHDNHLPIRIGFSLHGCFLGALSFGGVPIGTGLRLWSLLKETEQGRLFLRPLHPVSLKKYVTSCFLEIFLPTGPMSALLAASRQCERQSAAPVALISFAGKPTTTRVDGTALRRNMSFSSKQLSVVGTMTKFVMGDFVC